MAFTTWTQLYNNWLDALADRNPEAFFIASKENAHEMRTTYSNMGNIKTFTAWLKQKADEETLGHTDGQIPSAIGGI